MVNRNDIDKLLGAINDAEALRLKKSLKKQPQPSSAYIGNRNVYTLGASTPARQLGNRQLPVGAYSRGGAVGFDPGTVRPPKIEIFGRTTYPFKTLMLTPDYKLYLGGDRLPLQLAQVTETERQFYLGSFEDRSVLPNKITFLSLATSLTVMAISTPKPIGDNYWLDERVLGVSTNENRVVLSGSPPLPDKYTSDLDAESGNSLSLDGNFSIRYDHTAQLNSPAETSWPPYGTNPTYPTGSETWTQNTAYLRVESGSEPHGIDHTETRFGTITTPLRIFEYNSTLENPVEGYLGSKVVTRNHVINKDMNRATDYSSMNIIENHSKTDSEITTIPIALLGDRPYSKNISTEESFTLADTRSTGSGGASCDFSSTRIINRVNTFINPLNAILKGVDCCYVAEEITGFDEARQITETRTATANAETIFAFPSMRSPVISRQGDSTNDVTHYIISAATSGGANGAWYNLEGIIQTNVPVANIWRYGNANPPGFGSLLVPHLVAPPSIVYDQFASNGIYEFNSTNPNAGVFTLTTMQVAPTTRRAWGRIVNDWYTVSAISSSQLETKNFGRNFQSNLVTHTIQNIQDKTNYLLLTETETLEIIEEPTFVFSDIDPALVSAPSEAGTLTMTGNLEVYISKNKLIKEETTNTSGVIYTNGNINPDLTTNVTTKIYTSTETVNLGLAVEVYFLNNDGIVTQYMGTLSSYSGINYNPPPQNSNSSSGAVNASVTNTFIGAYPELISVSNILINITSVRSIKFCPFKLLPSTYTLVINPNFAFTQLVDSAFVNIKTTSTGATALVCNPDLYRAGKTNYAAQWDFAKQNDGKVKIIKRDKFVSGSTKSNGNLTGELVALQCF